MYIKTAFGTDLEKQLKEYWSKEDFEQYTQEVTKGFGYALRTTEAQFEKACLRELDWSVKLAFYLLVFKEETELEIFIGLSEDQGLSPVYSLQTEHIIFPFKAFTEKKAPSSFRDTAYYAAERVVSDFCRDGLSKEMKRNLNFIKQTLRLFRPGTWSDRIRL